MGDETFESFLKGTKRTQMIIWLAITTEPFVYVVLSFLVSQGAVECTGQTAGPYLKWGAYLFACLFAVASLLISRFLLSDRQIKARLQIGQLDSPEGLSERDSRLLSVAYYYLTPMLLSWGLNSFVPIGGLILLFATGDCNTILVLSALAVVLNLLAYPQLDAFVERVRSLQLEEEI
ncbi:MAG: hypothetical protein JW918_01735 [Anaerolineae bacterium]|nr:hypothetical protein [Anaerolineae bacterium]